ncbi:FAD-binding oxidoreductase [Streptomyces sp. AD16]|nr:FAD-binding oxidoreductase [Streptomyces sp. AD16]
MDTAVPRAAQTAPPRNSWYPLPVTLLDRLTEDTVAITLEVPGGLRERFVHRPGAHVVVRHRTGGRELRRSYSVCPPPEDPAALRLVVKRNTSDGFGAHALERLAAGDLLEVGPPAGHFGLPPVRGAHHLLIAGGCGITPLAPMAAAALREDPTCRVSLVHAARTARGALLADEMAVLKDAYVDRFTALYVLSRERRETELFSGRIDAGRLTRLLTLLGARPGPATRFAVCGPYGLVETVRSTLDGWGPSRTPSVSSCSPPTGRRRSPRPRRPPSAGAGSPPCSPGAPAR